MTEFHLEDDNLPPSDESPGFVLLPDKQEVLEWFMGLVKSNPSQAEEQANIDYAREHIGRTPEFTMWEKCVVPASLHAQNGDIEQFKSELNAWAGVTGRGREWAMLCFDLEHYRGRVHRMLLAADRDFIQFWERLGGDGEDLVLAFCPQLIDMLRWIRAGCQQEHQEKIRADVSRLLAAGDYLGCRDYCARLGEEGVAWLRENDAAFACWLYLWETDLKGAARDAVDSLSKGAEIVFTQLGRFVAVGSDEAFKQLVDLSGLTGLDFNSGKLLKTKAGEIKIVETQVADAKDRMQRLLEEIGYRVTSD